MTRSTIGDSPRRREDARFVTGQGAYLDDLRFDGVVHAAVLRSPHAHARLRSIDTTAARRSPGVPGALVVAETHAQALDAAELIAVDYEPLPAVTTAAAARAAGAPQLSSEIPGNVCLDWRAGGAAGAGAALFPGAPP